MPKVLRRTSLQVATDRLAELKRLEKLKVALEKDAAQVQHPFHWAAVVAVAKVAAKIATIVSLIRGVRRALKKK